MPLINGLRVIKFCSVLLCSRLLDAAVETRARLGMCGPSGASLFMTRVLKIRLFDIDRFTGVDLLHVSRAFLLFFPLFSLEVLFLLLVSFLCIIAVGFFFFFFFFINSTFLYYLNCLNHMIIDLIDFNC